MSNLLDYKSEIPKEQTDSAIFILAAGRGFRLFPITTFIPKYMIPISFNQKLISFSLKTCVESGYDTYLLVRTPKTLSQKFAVQFRDMRVKILSSPYYYETGGEVLSHYDFLVSCKYKYLIVLPSDYYMRDFPISDVIKRIEENRADIYVVGCPARRNGEYIKLGENGFIKKIWDGKTNFSSVGIYVIAVSVLLSNKDLRGKLITTTSLLNILINRGYRAKMYLYTGAWSDLGTWRRYLQFLIYFNLCSVYYGKETKNRIV